MTAPSDHRAQAARLLHRVVVRHETTDQALSGRSVSPLTQELVFGSLRHFYTLEQSVRSALHHPVKTKDQDIWLLMIVGAYQLYFTRIPDHAAIFETVSACSQLGKPWGRRLVNAVLRQCVASGPPPERSFEHPPWLESGLRQGYEDAEAIMLASNARAPMALRINLARAPPGDFVSRLESAGLPSRQPLGQQASRAGAQAVRGLGPECRILETPIPVRELPGYAEGLVSVQDPAAQFAAGLLSPDPGDRVLDACAAPGGKLFHLIERYPEARLTALEQNPRRLAHVSEEGTRLRHAGWTATCGDATGLDWWDGTPYQRVLVDAPCSGTGTLRRHPDIKLLRKPGDIARFAELQGRLLANLWRVLAPGGTLLYCTCSTLAPENDGVVAAFLAHHADASLCPFRLIAGRATRHGWQLLPTDPDTDGFYYARMDKAAA